VTVGFSSIPFDPGGTAVMLPLDRYPYGLYRQTVSRAMPLSFEPNWWRWAPAVARGQARGRAETAVSTRS